MRHGNAVEDENSDDGNVAVERGFYAHRQPFGRQTRRHDAFSRFVGGEEDQRQVGNCHHDHDDDDDDDA